MLVLVKGENWKFMEKNSLGAACEYPQTYTISQRWMTRKPESNVYHIGEGKSSHHPASLEQDPNQFHNNHLCCYFF